MIVLECTYCLVQYLQLIGLEDAVLVDEQKGLQGGVGGMVRFGEDFQRLR